MRVLRIYHGGRDPAHRQRDVALAVSGVELHLVIPTIWPGDEPGPITGDGYVVHELPTKRPGDVNRHTWLDPGKIAALAESTGAELVDIHEEPFSASLHQLVKVLPPNLPVVCYTAQNLDKRFPPPFAQWERAAFRRLWGIDACSRQAASVVMGKGFRGQLLPLALGTDADRLIAGDQSLDADELKVGLIGRMVPEKGLDAALDVLAALHARRPTRLLLVGDGPALAAALAEAEVRGLAGAVTHIAWIDAAGLAEIYRSLHWVLVPSRATATWVEQFGRVVTEGQACGAVVAGYASGSLPEVVANTGLLVAEGRALDLTAQMIEAMADGAWARWRSEGLARASEFTWATVAAKQAQFYDQVIAAGPPPAPSRGARAAAVAAFGPPARALGSARPFALPVLRDDTPVSRLAERVVDAVVRA